MADSRDTLSSEATKASPHQNSETPTGAVVDADTEAEKEGQTVAPTSEGKPSQSHGPPGPAPPDGGLQAWLQVVGGWCLFFNTWGVLNTFGVYQTYYESGALWHASSSDISWIGAIQSFMVLVVGIFAGPIYDRGHFKLLLGVGTFGVVFGHMMLSLTHTYWQALLAQGFVIGVGGGCLFIPAVAIMPTYFRAKLGMAIGLAASGSSSGGIIYPIMFYKLVPEVGYPWAVRILGFTTLATLAVPLALMKQRVKPGKARALIDFTVFTDWPFLTFCLGCVLGYIGLYTGFFYTSYYANATGITDASLSFYLVPILNAGSVLGRTVPNFVSDKAGPFNVIMPGTCIVGIVLLCYLAATNVAGIVICALLFGFFSGILIALPPVLFFALTKDKSKVGTRMGMGFAFIGIGVLAGGPGAGGIVGSNAKNLHWTPTWIFAGVCCLASSAVFLLQRVQRAGVRMVKV